MQALKDVVRVMLHRLGCDARRYERGYDFIRVPESDSVLNPLELAVRYRLSIDPKFFFIQVGANDGVRNDPLHELIIRFHLRGLLVEPLPDVYEKLRANYASEPQLMFENAAVARETAQVRLFRFRPEASPDFVQGMPTFNGQRLRAVARKHRLQQSLEEVWVTGLTFGDLLKKHYIPHVTLLQVDTEGFDFEVIKMAFAAGVEPEMLNYEFTHLSAVDRLTLSALLREKSYRLIHSKYDTFAMRWPPVSGADYFGE